jgi:hypothetical protein
MNLCAIQSLQNTNVMYKLIIPLLLLTLCTKVTFAQNATEPKRISFTLTNSSLKAKMIDIRHFDVAQSKARGYGYGLNALGSHAVNMPVGTRIYEKQNGEWQLKIVIRAEDDGRKFDLRKTYEIKREEWLDAAYAEQNERTAHLEKIEEKVDLETFAKNAGLAMITFKVAGKSLWGKQVYVRAEIPGKDPSFMAGFSRKLSSSSVYRVSYPEGTKLYSCEGPYWEGKKVAETLIVVVDAEKANYLIRI